MKSISAEAVRNLLTYDQETGVFTWRSARGRAAAGSKAGTKHGRGYVQIRISGRNYFAHRLAWLYISGQMPSAEIDHINGVTSDNRICNLRHVSHQSNQRNMARYRSNRSGITGVSFDRGMRKWVSSISTNEGRKVLGYFSDKDDAAQARKDAESNNEYHPNHGRDS